LDGTHGMKLTNFKFNHPKKILFTYTKDQNKVINDNLDFYGNNLIGKTKALKSIPFQQLWRRPTGIENPSTSENIREIETKRWNTL
jgi:hypothetical protein